MTDVRPAAVVVLAAGEGTRMRSATPKVLHRFCGRTMLGHVTAASRELDAVRTLVVVGAARDQVIAHLSEAEPAAQPVVQDDPRGTGHAVRVALDAVPDLDGTVVIVPGDAPLLSGDMLRKLVAAHEMHRAAGTLLTAELPDPTGYGRVVRDGAVVRAVIEHRDADAATLEIREVATSVFAFDAKLLRAALPRLGTDNAQEEEYLTDVVGLLYSDGHVVMSVAAEDWRETLGVNDRVQLAAAARILRERILERHMLDGVTVADPATTWVDVDVELEPDVTLLPGTRLQGRTTVSRGAVIGPDTTLRDTTVGAGATVSSSTCIGAEIGAGASVGPYTYLRPGTRLGRGAKAGAYVEMKAAVVAADAKVPHLSYVGDAEIGPGTNVGAATVFVNYDGRDKHRTTVGADVRIGSDTMLVAPVEVGDGAYTAAGSVITEDVPPGALAVARSPQQNVDGWVERMRPDTPSAEAARRARERIDSGESGARQ